MERKSVIVAVDAVHSMMSSAAELFLRCHQLQNNFCDVISCGIISAMSSAAELYPTQLTQKVSLAGACQSN